jgi:hypothetical protein
MKTTSLNTVIDAVADILMQRQERGLRVDELVAERVLADVIEDEPEQQLLDRVLAQPVIRETIDVANMVFDVDEPIVNAGGLHFEIPGGTAAYIRDVL